VLTMVKRESIVYEDKSSPRIDENKGGGVECKLADEKDQQPQDDAKRRNNQQNNK